MKHDHNWIADAAKALAGGASSSSKSGTHTPRHEIQQANERLNTKRGTPAEPLSSGPQLARTPTSARPEEPELAVQHSCDHQLAFDSQPHSSGGQPDRASHRSAAPTGTEIRVGHPVIETQNDNADTDPICQQLVEEWRRRQDFLRARQRLDLQAQSVCRRICDGDKDKAAKLWAEVKKDADHELRVWLAPYIAGMAPLEAAKVEREKVLAKLVKKLPIYAWAKGVGGLGDVSLAGIIGECGKFQPGEYRSVSALWKRMGMAVIEGERQRRVTGAAALDHGYNAERRSLMWNIGCCLIKAQVRSEKDEKGKKIPGSEYAIGELGALYLSHKAALAARNEAGGFAETAARAVERAKKAGSKPNDANLEGRITKPHLHNMAQRYIEKRLLRQLWQAWRGGQMPNEIQRPFAPSPQPIQGGAGIVPQTESSSPLPEALGEAA